MKSTPLSRIVSGICLFFLFAISAQAQDVAAIKFDKTSFDFGTIEKGQKVSTSFHFTNMGTTELKILDIKPSCGCTTIDVKELKATYLPGEGGAIPVSFDSKRFTGDVTKKITLFIDDAAKSELVLIMTATVKPEISQSLNSLTMIKLEKNEIRSQDIEFKAELLDELNISEVRFSPEHILSGTVTRKDSKTSVLTVNVDGSKVDPSKNRVNGIITVKTWPNFDCLFL